MTWPTSEVVVWTRGASPTTVTVSACVATFTVKSTVTELPTWTGTALRTWLPKPLSSTVMSYVPAGSAATR